jgi:hypothetical protein
MTRNRRGLLFSIVSLLFAFSIIVFFLNFQLFFNDAASMQADALLGAQTHVISQDFEEIIDLRINTEKTQTRTRVNFSDRLPRADSFRSDVNAYQNFLENQLNISYITRLDLSAFLDTPTVNLGGVNTEYQWPNMTKANMSLVQKKNNALFVETYNITMRSLQDLTLNNCTLAQGGECGTLTGTDNLTVVIDTEDDGTCGTLCDVGPVDVARDSGTTFIFNYSDNGVGKQVNITVGQVTSVTSQNTFTSSLKTVPNTNVSLMTEMTVKDSSIN